MCSNPFVVCFYTFVSLLLPLQSRGSAVAPREVHQFHFLAWPDHGVPHDPGCVLSFLQDITDKHRSLGATGPFIVHCR